MALLVIAVLFLMFAITSNSYVSPAIASYGNSAVSLAHAPSVKAVGVPAPSAKLRAHKASPCLEGSLHINGPGCASGCCPACYSAVFFRVTSDFYRNDTGTYGSSSQDGLAPAKQDPNFRPPRLYFT